MEPQIWRIPTYYPSEGHKLFCSPQGGPWVSLSQIQECEFLKNVSTKAIYLSKEKLFYNKCDIIESSKQSQICNISFSVYMCVHTVHM